MAAPPPILFSGARLVDPSRALDAVGALLVTDGVIRAAGPELLAGDAPEGCEIVDARGLVLAPGLVDARVFVGEPGFEHRETLATASRAAAAGGVTTIVTMPDTDPVIDDPALVDFILRRAGAACDVRVAPMAALTKGLKGAEMAEIGLLAEAGAVAFTDGRHALANPQLLRRILTYARDFDALVVNHVEDAALAGAGVVHASALATRLGLPGIPVEAETIMLERDLRLAAMTGGRYHAALLSSAESVEIVRAAKRRGVDVSAGVSINHLSLNELDVGTYRSFLKLSPPLRSEDDRLALVAGVADGTIDLIVSAHDPQDVETKRQPFAEAAAGAVGLETLLSAGLRLVESGHLSLLALVDALSTRPARRLRLTAGTLTPGAAADLVLFDAGAPWVLDRSALRSRAKNTPFEDARLTGRVRRTLVGGRTVYRGDDA